jgi:hypothetical protein
MLASDEKEIVKWTRTSAKGIVSLTKIKNKEFCVKMC